MGQTTSSSAKIDFLTPIWQRVLHRSPIAPDENFFALGGDPSAAAEIFQEITRKGGVALPPFVIYQAPTISSLAVLLSKSKTAEFPSLVLLKPGTEGLPIFITHGVGGHLLEFFFLVRTIITSRPIYGLQSRGMDGFGEPFERIEDMAVYFLEAVRKVQPRGPYTLIGYSLGGMVTLEMARRLKESGEKIALLAMLDSYPGREALAFSERVRLMTRLAKSHLLKKLFRRNITARTTAQAQADELYEHMMSFPAMPRVLAGSNRALSRYRPTSYAGNVRFVRASIPTRFPANPIPVWSRFLPGLAVESVPGDHHEILTDHCGELASMLTRYLKETEIS